LHAQSASWSAGRSGSQHQMSVRQAARTLRRRSKSAVERNPELSAETAEIARSYEPTSSPATAVWTYPEQRWPKTEHLSANIHSASDSLSLLDTHETGKPVNLREKEGVPNSSNFTNSKCVWPSQSAGTVFESLVCSPSRSVGLCGALLWVASRSAWYRRGLEPHNHFGLRILRTILLPKLQGFARTCRKLLTAVDKQLYVYVVSHWVEFLHRLRGQRTPQRTPNLRPYIIVQ